MDGVELGILIAGIQRRLESVEISVATLLGFPSLEPRIVALEVDLAEAAADLAAIAADLREAEEAAVPEPEPEPAPEPEPEPAPPEPEPEPEPEVTPVRQMWLHRRIGRGA